MRTMTDAAIAELRKSVVNPFLLCDIQFADEWLHTWTGLGDLTISATTYLGTGNLLSISTVSETSDIQANSLTLSLAGVSNDVLSKALSQCKQGQPVTLSLGMMANSGTVIADPVILMAGKLDSAGVEEGDSTSTVSISVEGRLADLQRSRVRRFTNDDQQRTSPGDKGFIYVPMIQDWNQPWGYTPPDKGIFGSFMKWTAIVGIA